MHFEDRYIIGTLLTLSEYRAFLNLFPAEANEKFDTCVINGAVKVKYMNMIKQRVN